ncbi:flagellar motor protein MotB [Flavobacterium sediminis]|uniref:Flagellar motor protein MotB n=1 Tax=Flavobacterium sediminis TaxID=2201181 RepID=A0A2U8QY86_9FLAO|nr:OmpA family protein [Flavobacterium sediminis]AWM14876.1 flagellar motor protein MotB [Flavobacterium sediminis]
MKNILFILFFFSGSLLFSQSLLEKANKHFEAMEFQDAIEKYEKYLEKNSNAGQNTYLKLADSYFNLTEYEKALKWYSKVYEIQQNTMSEYNFLKYVECLKANRDNEKANELLKNYFKNDTEKLKLLAYQKKELDSLDKKDPLFKIKHLEINTNKSDFGTVKYTENRVIFYSTRDTSNLSQKMYSWNDQPYLNTYIAERNLTTNELHNESLFLQNLKTNFHDATLTFSPDFKLIYFTENYLKKSNKIKVNKEGFSNMKILRGKIEEDKVTDIEVLQFNDVSYSCAHPCLSDDGKYLFFVSDMPGGYGETDIYYCEVFPDGSINTPVNAGPYVNTVGREMFPYFEKNILYFASDGHFGLGGLDIFEVEMKGKNNFLLPKNLGAPINSNRDDFAFSIYSDDHYGYFSSNRSLGKGDDDIYFFTKEEIKSEQYYSGTVLDKTTELPLPDATISVKDVFGDEVQSLQSDAEGNFNIALPCDSNFTVTFSKPNYTTETVTVTTTSEPMKEMSNNKIYLTNYDSLVEKDGDVEKVKVNPIYFDLDKYAITPKAEIELDKVVYTMEKFPNVKIKIESHTDSRGSDAHNLILSDNRAKSTQAYILSKGISPERIESAIGYGETRLKVNCPNGVKCSEEQHAINRRSDFIIISK